MSDKILPPFNNLPIFNANATILSYLAYQDEVFALLSLLSRRAKRFSEAHKEILDNFLYVWEPKLTGVL